MTEEFAKKAEKDVGCYYFYRRKEAETQSVEGTTLVEWGPFGIEGLLNPRAIVWVPLNRPSTNSAVSNSVFYSLIFFYLFLFYAS